MQLLNYKHLALSLVLSVLLFQVFSAQFFGSVASAYSVERLQDPSVARVVFEHVVGASVGGSGAEPAELYTDSTILEIASEIRERLTEINPDADLNRIMVFGRRSIPGSALRFPGANEKCQGWQPIETIALSAEDPLFLQTKLIEERGFVSDIGVGIDPRR